MPMKKNNGGWQEYDPGDGKFVGDGSGGESPKEPSEEEIRKERDKKSVFRQYAKTLDDIEADVFSAKLDDMLGEMDELFPDAESFNEASEGAKKDAILLPRDPEYDPNDILKNFTKVNKDAYDGVDDEMGSTQFNYMINCQVCAPCGELRFRGYDVDAGARGLYGANNHFASIKFIQDGKTKYINSMALFGITEDNIVNLAKGSDLQKNRDMDLKAENDMKRLIESQPVGSRFLLSMMYKGGGGHILNVINDHGKAKVVDCQPGRYYELGDGSFCEHYKGVNPSHALTIVRVDDKDIDDRKIDYIIDRKSPSDASDVSRWKQKRKEKEEAEANTEVDKR